MSQDVHDSKRLNDMRRKLYARSGAQDSVERHKLTDTQVDVSRNWDLPTPPPKPVQPEPEKPRRRYRIVILLVSLFIFIFGVGLSSLYLYLGGNEVSSDNISLAVDGPLTAGGGEVLNFTVAVNNQNVVAMESATLIVKYPQGTRSAGETPRNLFEQRIPVASVAPGEVQNIPLQVVVFGEESARQSITATIEYRIAGSNSVFYKEAESYDYSISSSPVVLRVENIRNVSSGQLVEVELTIVSNASTPQQDVLISASYPSGFRFESSNPIPVFGNSVWSIGELLPEETATVRLTGAVTGFADEELRINFDVGPAQTNEPFIVDSLLAEASADFVIESPFIDIVTRINGDEETSVVLEPDQRSNIDVQLTNILDASVYDMTVEVVPGGNVLAEDSIVSGNGFYDSNTGTIRWEVANNNTFEQVGPGESRRLSFSVTPTSMRPTASYNLAINVYARRVNDANAEPQLIGTSLIEAKFNTATLLGSQVGRGGLFTSVGIIPPQVGQTTSYTMTMVVAAESNDLTDAVVTSALPIYVNWLDQVQGDGELSFNSVSQQLEWDAGPISAGSRKEVSFQVSLTPSASQVGSSPVLLNRQTFRATDRFTGARLQAQADPVYTELSTEAGFPEDNGRVAP